MKLFLVTYVLTTSILFVRAKIEEEVSDTNVKITSLSAIGLGEKERNPDSRNFEIQSKRNSVYPYQKSHSSAPSSRARYQIGQSSRRGHVFNRQAEQMNKPNHKYGPPGYQILSQAKPISNDQQHRNKLQLQSHFNQQLSGKLNNQVNGLQEQDVPSRNREVNFVEPNSISLQNNQPFALHSAHYLPPKNQMLPRHLAAHTFSVTQAPQNFQANKQDQLINLQTANIGLPHGQISDAVTFLTQNARAIQELYGSPPKELSFAPHRDNFLDNSNQVPSVNAQLQSFKSEMQSAQDFSNFLPPYASGVLSPQESLEKIQSYEKDRLIVQLQQALATQAKNVDEIGRYAQHQLGFVQNQDFLASLGHRMKIQNSKMQQPGLSGTTISPRFPLSYGLLTKNHPPECSISTKSISMQPVQASKDDNTFVVVSSTPGPSVPSHLSEGVIHRELVPTLDHKPSFNSNIPFYGSNISTQLHNVDTTPTYFGLPIPTESAYKPSTSETIPSSSASVTPTMLSTVDPTVPHSTSVDTVALPTHSVPSLHQLAAAFHTVTPLRLVLPVTSAQVHSAQTPPTKQLVYGSAATVINSHLYKPVKAVYPFYYYSNTGHPSQMPTQSMLPWIYAPTYSQPQTSPIWK